MKNIAWFFAAAMIAPLVTAGCKDDKEKACEHAHKMIKKCMPKLAGNKARHVRVCTETFKKSSTKGTVVCAKTFAQCDEFAVCLNYSALCADYEGAKFKVCLNSAPMCGAYKGKKFKACIKCVAEKGLKGEAIGACVSDMTGEKEPGTGEPDGAPKKPAAPAMVPPAMAPVPAMAPAPAMATPEPPMPTTPDPMNAMK